VSAKLLVIDAREGLRHVARETFADILRAGDLVVANDAATLPASLHGTHVRSGEPIEVRLAGRPAAPTCPPKRLSRRRKPSAKAGPSLSTDVADFSAIVFGAGDFSTRTEDRPPPPALSSGDILVLGPLSATVTALLEHPRFISLHFHGSSDAIWSGIARHGRPVQYAHVQSPLALWDVWTPIASPPVAFEPPSAGFALDWQMIATLRAHHIGFATITHAAGISSTGDPQLDRRLPFDEPYDIPRSTALAIERTRAAGGRIVAIGTTVVRALEHSAMDDATVRAGARVATQRIGPGTPLRVVDAILTGVHERGTSHYELLRAFADDDVLSAAEKELITHGYRPHEFGDSVLVFPALPRHALCAP
jgi:S-adenosylmethionine:tRNA ribosyltransferase-isomerase